MAFSFLLLGGALLFVAFGGLGKDWLAENVTCGVRSNTYTCAPGEAETVLKIVGGIFAAIGLLELALSLVLARVATVVDDFGSAIDPAALSAWSPAPSAPAHGTLAERLARLAALRDQGVLTETEFQAQKVKLLQ